MPANNEPTRSSQPAGRRTAGIAIEAWTHSASYFHLKHADIQPAIIKQLAKGNGHDSWDFEGTAEIVADPEHARVGAFFKGHLVGYFTAIDARPYVKPLRRLTLNNVHLLAPIRGQWSLHEYAGDAPMIESYHTVQLRSPGCLVPLNAPPDQAHIMLPPGGPIKATAGPEHLKTLKRYIAPSGKSDVHTTLHAITIERPRSTVSLVEARIDGYPAGTLSKLMSDQMLPVVGELAGAGIATACRAMVSGNSLAAELILYAARPAQLSNAWFADSLAGLR